MSVSSVDPQCHGKLPMCDWWKRGPLRHGPRLARPRSSEGHRRLSVVISFVITVACAGASHAEPSSDEHSAHHGGGIAASGVPGAQAPAEAPPGGMGEMMREMGKAPKPELYPSLMNLPALTPAEREDMQRLAHERMRSGEALLSSGFAALSAAAGVDPAMQSAAAEIREGLKQFEDGLSAHLALADGKRPDGIALNWFKQNLDLEGPTPHRQWTILGLAPMHLIVMVLLAGFGLATIGTHFFRVRRASALLARLTTTPPSSAPPTAPALTMAPGAGPAPPSSGAPPPSAVAPPSASGVTRWAGALRIARIGRETAGVKTFRLVAADGGPIPFTFLPGQFLNVALAIDGSRVRRSYTIASSPSERGWLELTIKRDERGLVSRYLHDQLHEGDALQVNAPFGTFTFTGEEADSIVLIGAGVGVTPVMSVLRYLIATAWPHEVYFLYCVRFPADIIFRGEIEMLARRFPNLHVTITVSSPDASWRGSTGRITKDMIVAAVPDLARRRVHVCGPQAMMDGTKASLVQLGVSASQIKMEDFGSPAPRSVPPPMVAASVPVAALIGPRVEFTRSHKTTSIAGRTVLEASESIDVDIPWSCRVGTCGVCKSHLVSGEVTMAVEDGLDPGDKERGMILACQARATVDIAVGA